MSSCVSAREIAGYLGGTLAAVQSRDVKAHLDACADCRRAVAAAERDATTEPRALAAGDRVGRFIVLRLVGSGGMGRVYAAYDPDLDRKVALKLVRPDVGGADVQTRLVREAQAMARLHHPEVITVYEVGALHDVVFIAMELVDGGTLRSWLAAERRSIEAIVERFVRAGEGLSAAHAAGLVHRDFKPDNVLVGDDGRQRVTDFGLARMSDTIEPPVASELSPTSPLNATLTATGVLHGTLAYMAPEQLDGEPVNARSDQFSFCVALYQALYGELPFAGDNVRALRAAVALEQIRPAPARARVPKGLRAVLVRGLKARPNDRFPTMDALLAALRQRTRRQRAQRLGVAAALLLLAAAVVGEGVRVGVVSRRERVRASERARLAASLGQESKEIEWLLRAAYQLPLHDTTPEREAIRARMKRIAATRHDLGALGDTMIHEALGHGYLALREWTHAADELTLAAAAGLDSASLHAARARVLGEQYRRALELRRYTDDKKTQSSADKLDREFLVPARRELEKSRAGDDPSLDLGFLDALAALYHHDYARAEQQALAVAAQKPLLFEARKLAGDVAYEAAINESEHGAYDQARDSLHRALARYAAAAEVARSDADIFVSAADAEQRLADLDYRQSRDPEAAIDRALAQVDLALRADPRNAEAYMTRTSALNLADTVPAVRLKKGEPKLLDDIAAAASRAVELDPSDARAWNAIAVAHSARGDRGREDPLPWYAKAVAEEEHAIALAPDVPRFHRYLGRVHCWIAMHQQILGQDTTKEFAAAVRSDARALELDPQDLDTINDALYVRAWIAAGRLTHGLDPSDAVNAAQPLVERALAVNPNSTFTYSFAASLQLILARYLLDAGRDPTPPLKITYADLDKADALKGDVDSTRAYAAMVEARFLIRSGGDPAEALATGRRAIARAVAREPDDDAALVTGVDLELAAAELAARKGQPVVPLLEQARRYARRGLALGYTEGGNELANARVCLRFATLVKGPRALSEIRDGLAYAEADMRQAPGGADAHAVKAELLVARAHLDGTADLATARAEAAKAFAIKPTLRNEWRDELREVDTPRQ